MTRRWLETLGGPFVVVPADQILAWGGADENADGPTDYEAACDVHAELGLLTRNGVDILVLGDDIRRTTTLTIDGVPACARWCWAPNEQHVHHVLDALTLASLPPAEQELAWDVPGIVELFDAVHPGNEAIDRLEVLLAAGRYRISAHRVEPDGDTRLEIVLFTPGDVPTR